MSWTVYNVPFADQGEDLSGAVARQVKAQGITVNEEQVAAAVKAAEVLIESGALGEPPFNVNLAGHANPDHQPVDGWSNDHVTVTVSQANRS